MDNPLQRVTIAGGERELLYTLSLYKILQERKQSVVIEKEATWADVISAMLRMMYAAYLNAIQVRQIDNPSYNPERVKYMDFVVWSESNSEEFAQQVKICYKFITGQDLNEELKKKLNPQQITHSQKTSIWSKIGKICRVFSSGKKD